MPYLERDEAGNVVAVTALPQEPGQECRPDDHPDVVAFIGRLDTLAHRKAQARRDVDFAAEGARQAFLTPGVGQSLVYGMKMAEAAYIELGDPDLDQGNAYKLLAAEAEARGISVEDLAGLILSAADRFVVATAQIEALRFEAKAAIERVADDAHADDAIALILKELSWPEPSS